MAYQQSVNNIFDTQGLTALSARAGKGDAQATKEVAIQFESLFIQQMLKSMRATMPGDPLFGGKGVDHFNELRDKQLAMNLAGQGGLGVAKLIEEQMLRQQGKLPSPETSAVPVGVINKPVDLSRLNMELQRFNGSVKPVTETVETPIELSKKLSVQPTPIPSQSSADNLTTSVPKIDAAGFISVGSKGALFDDRDAFVEQLMPHAERIGQRLGVDPKAIVAQAALETGWGKAVITRANGDSSFNLFGIKQGYGWKGDGVKVSTLEYDGGVPVRQTATFRAYGSLEEAFDGYAEFLMSNPRYGDALQQASDTPQWLQGLQNAGYATDPRYAEKIQRIMDSRVLAARDQ